MGKTQENKKNKYRLPPPRKFEEGVYKALASRLTERDIDIAYDVFINKVLTVRQIHRMHFPDVAPGDEAPVSRRMKILEELGHVQVLRRPGERRNFYTAGPEYIRMAAWDSNRHTGFLYRSYLREVVETLAFDHRIMLGDVYSFFQREENLGRGELVDWLPEPGTRLSFKYRGKNKSLIPDAKGIWGSYVSQRNVHFLEEADRSTMRLELIHEKFERYLALLARLGFARVGERLVFPVVLIVAETYRRA